MSNDKVMTKEIAEQFLSDEGSVDLSDYTTMDDQAAEILNQLKKDYLHLNDLTSLSDAAVESLSKFRGWKKELPCN